MKQFHKLKMLLAFAVALALGIAYLPVRAQAIGNDLESENCVASDFSATQFNGMFITLNINQVTNSDGSREICREDRNCKWKLRFSFSNVHPSASQICLVAVNCFSGERCFDIPGNTSQDVDQVVHGICATRCEYSIEVRDSSGGLLETLGSIFLHCADCA